MRSRTPVLVAVVFATLLFGSLFSASLFYVSGSGRILHGVRIAGVPVGGLSREAAAEVTSRLDRDLFRRTLRVAAPDREWILTPSTIGYRLDARRTAERAFAVGRASSLPYRIGVWRRLLAGGIDVEPVITLDLAKLHTTLLAWADALRRPSKNAHFNPTNGRVTPEETGLEVDIEATASAIRSALTAVGPRTVQMKVRTLRPPVTLSQLTTVGAREVLGQFTTTFDPKDINRKTNMALAAAAIDGHIIQPGETFSFNRTVGPRTLERGYKTAPEIVREKFVTGIGGGTCQVSSTLYNAALLAGLAMIERTNHSQPLGYVQVGRDATVYYGLIDLKFRNNLNFPVVISSDLADRALTVAICGRNDGLPEVRLQVGAVEPVEAGETTELDPALPPGARELVAEPRLGYRVVVTRLFLRNGKEVGRELVSRDFYKPRPRTYRVGPPPSIAPGTGAPARPIPSQPPAPVTHGVQGPAERGGPAPTPTSDASRTAPKVTREERQ